MEILLTRGYKKADYTIGELKIDGEFVCSTLEDTDRGLDDGMELWKIRNMKIPTRTAVPTGRYEVLLDVVSPKFSQRDFYKQVCEGRLPRIKDVKGFEGILMHCGSDHTHSEGCILVGMNTQVGKLTDSKETFKKIYGMMQEAHKRGETIHITIE